MKYSRLFFQGDHWPTSLYYSLSPCFFLPGVITPSSTATLSFLKRWRGPRAVKPSENPALVWNWVLLVGFNEGLTQRSQLGPPTTPAVSLCALVLHFLHTPDTLSHSCSLFTYLTIFCNHTLIQYPAITSSPPPFPAVEVVSVMAVGRLTAAGELLINSLFICVERRAPAFWALVLWWR